MVTTDNLRYDQAPDRRENILSRLRAAGFLSVSALAEDLGVSDMTIRRDLRRLASDGEVRIVHGGASLPHPTLRTSEFVSRARAHAEEKRMIAHRAVELIGPSDTIAIDAGTTTYDVVHELPDEFSGCVVSHSVPVLQALLARPEPRVVGLGGDLFRSSQAFVGPLTESAAAGLRVRVFFLGAAGVDEKGVYVEADIERPTKLALIEAADVVVLLADRSKFEHPATVRLCGLEQLDRVITDQEPPERIRQALATAGVDVTSS
nr:DeoR/GlpR family DNA-binding transcription regulator [Phytoactinopolyspora mesophila]